MKKKMFKDNIKVSEIILESVNTDVPRSGTKLPVLGSFKVKGMTVENVQNQNGRVYSEAVWQQPTSFGRGGKYIDENGKMRPNILYGSLDHPLDDRTDFRLEEAAIAWFNVERNSDGTWDGEADILATEKGRVIHALLEYAKYRKSVGLLGVSSRAMGEAALVETSNGTVESIIPEGFELVSFDFVYNPSFQSANPLLESKKNRVALTESIKSLAKEDPEHAEYYEKVAESLVGESEEEPKEIEQVKTENKVEELNQEIKPIQEADKEKEEAEKEEAEKEEAEKEEAEKEEAEKEDNEEDELDEEEDKEEKEEKPTIESLSAEVKELKTMLQDIMNLLMPTEPAVDEFELDEELPGEVEDEQLPLDDIELSDDDLDGMSEEELDYLERALQDNK